MCRTAKVIAIIYFFCCALHELRLIVTVKRHVYHIKIGFTLD